MVPQLLRKIPNILRKPNVHYRINKRPLLLSIQCQINPIKYILTLFFKIEFNIIALATLIK
jgi:hypothetical protein